MSKVAIIKCDNYDYDRVKKAMLKGIELLGGIKQFVKKGEKILLKPNLLTGAAPEKCVTTHPAVFKAVAEIFLAAGAKVSYGDSPGFGTPKGVAAKSGIKAVGDQLGLELADFVNGQDVFFEEGHQNKKFFVAKGVLANDGIVSLPKLKTHGFQKMTGSVKNQFGCIPGLLKGEFHARVPNASDFAKMLLDLNQCVNPRLYVMDGIEAMEGNGPMGGIPKKMNILLLSNDPIALDATVCRLIDVNPELVPTVKYGQEFGYGVFEESKMELLGDSLDDFKADDFDIDKTRIKPFEPTGMFKFISNRLVINPVINKSKCVKCGVCVKVCPATPKAVNWFDGEKLNPPTYNYKDCIRCYCCQELCPESAIKLRKPLLRRILPV